MNGVERQSALETTDTHTSGIQIAARFWLRFRIPDRSGSSGSGPEAPRFSARNDQKRKPTVPVRVIPSKSVPISILSLTMYFVSTPK